MSWTESLVRVREFEIEVLRKRLGGVMAAKAAATDALSALDQEADRENRHARQDAEAAWSFVGFRAGWKVRRAKAAGELKSLEMEEQGCRDALSEAFTELKKVEHVAEAHALAATKAAAKRESVALDEIALRKKTG